MDKSRCLPTSCSSRYSKKRDIGLTSPSKYHLAGPSRVFRRLGILGSLFPIVTSSACTKAVPSYLTKFSPWCFFPYTLIGSMPML